MFIDSVESRAALVPRGVAPKLRRTNGGQLMLTKDGKETVVSVHRCFPWSEPLAWLSLRDDESQELALIENPRAELDETSRLELYLALEESSFVFVIEGIVSIEDEFELRQWRVRLREGERVFQTKLASWPRELTGGGLLIQDVGNDLYLIPELQKLDPASQKKLWAFLD